MFGDFEGLQQFPVIPGTRQDCWTGGRHHPVHCSLATRTPRWFRLVRRHHRCLQDAPTTLRPTDTSELKFKHQRIRNKSLATPTLSLRAVRPADDVRISFMKLPTALSGKFTLLKLQDVSRLHGNRPHLHLMPILQRHGDVTPWDLDPLQHVHRSLAAGRLTRQQSFGITGGQEVCWRRRLGLGGLGTEQRGSAEKCCVTPRKTGTNPSILVLCSPAGPVQELLPEQNRLFILRNAAQQGPARTTLPPPGDASKSDRVFRIRG